LTLVDTTVWIDFLAGRPTRHVAALEGLIEDRDDLCLCGVILTEVLQGIRDPKELDRTATAFESLIFLPMSRETFYLAADLYRSLRRRGITVRKSVDCMIAAVALENDVQLLHNDRDFEPIREHCGLKTVDV
jgi:predicted nucleic acid-binding protein